jgi:hypothetical protein
MDYFSEACETFRYLRELDYPPKAALKLVADHHRLSGPERNSIFRAIVPSSVAQKRREKSIAPDAVGENPLGVDWYNVLITVESHLRGVPLFVCDDGMVRDAAAAHGSFRSTPLTDRALAEIVVTLRALAPLRVDVFLDAPIAHSGDMAERARALCAGLPFPVEASLAHSADYPLKSYPGIVASSDSAIIDRAERVFDLAAATLARGFGFTPPAILDLPRARRE